MCRVRQTRWPDALGPVKKYVGQVEWPVVGPSGPVAAGSAATGAKLVKEIRSHFKCSLQPLVKNKMSKEYEASVRKRGFLVSWKTQYTWVEKGDDGDGMYCIVCQQFPAKADRGGSFFKGTRNFRKQALDAHDKSRQHLQCVLAKRVADNLSAGPLHNWTQGSNNDTIERIVKLINTAYHIANSEHPFTTKEKTVALLKKNGEDVGSQYLTDVACQR